MPETMHYELKHNLSENSINSDEEDVDWHLTSFIHVRNVTKQADIVKEFGTIGDKVREEGATKDGSKANAEENFNTMADLQNTAMGEDTGVTSDHLWHLNAGLKKIPDKNISISRPFMCLTCEKIYPSKSLLENHNNNVHLGIKNHCCETCGKYFTTKVNLNRHKTIHTDSALKCTICGKAEMDKKHMDQHMMVHSDVRNYVCECGKAFKRNGDLTQHKGRCRTQS